MVRKAPSRDGLYDEWLEQSIEAIRKHIRDNNDDWLTLIIGPPGSGKSNLALHIMDLYMKDEATVEVCGLNKSSIAKAMTKAKAMEMNRFCWVDEANVSKRESLSTYNRALIDLFLAVRGLEIFWLWCNPSLDMMDKYFIEERIKGYYYTPSKNQGARPYYYFSKDVILTMLEKYGKLTQKILHKNRKKFATYKGWYKPYPNNDLYKDYEEKKDTRMHQKIEDFCAEWANKSDQETMTQKEVLRYLGITRATFKKIQAQLLEDEAIVEGVDFFIHPSGRKSYNRTTLPHFEKIIKKNREKSLNNLGGYKLAKQSKE